MPILLLREVSTTSLSTLVEKAQTQSFAPSLEYDIQLNNGHLELVPLSISTVVAKPTLTTTKPAGRKLTSTSTTDEGFDESDIDSLSLVSSDNDSFTTDKLLMENDGDLPKPITTTTTTETDSANGSSSSSDSDTEIVAETIKSSKTFNDGNNINEDANSILTPKESYNLVDCVCYTDVKCTDILLFVIKNEAFVFKFDNITHLQTFYTNFTTLKAIANQKAYNKNFATKFNLLQRTDQNGVTHIEITREPETRKAAAAAKQSKNESSIISINTPEIDVFGNYTKNKSRDVNSRQRSESQYINEIKYNTINSKLGPKAKIITKSNSIENILDLDRSNSNLVITNQGSNNLQYHYLRKVWNSAEDLLDDQEVPKRPVRRKKGKAPSPPLMQVQEKQDVLSGQYVRVNVNFDPIKDFNRSNNRLIIKSSSILNEPHPKKFQNFNISSSAKPASLMTSLLKSKEKQQQQQTLKYEPKKHDNNCGTLNRNNGKSATESTNNIWTNSVPRMLRKPRSKSETRNFVPMAYRYIDTTHLDYPTKKSYNNHSNTKSSGGHFPQNPLIAYGHNLALSNYLRNESGGGGGTANQNNQNISNRLFGLSPKLRDFNNADDSRWVEPTVIVTKDNNLKSVIKNNSKDDNMVMMNKKKNDKKVTFSAYTTVQVV